MCRNTFVSAYFLLSQVGYRLPLMYRQLINSVRNIQHVQSLQIMVHHAVEAGLSLPPVDWGGFCAESPSRRAAVVAALFAEHLVVQPPVAAVVEQSVLAAATEFDEVVADRRTLK